MKINSELYVYSMDGTFIARTKTLAQAIKIADDYFFSYVVDVFDHFIYGDIDSYHEGVMNMTFGTNYNCSIR